MAQTRKYSTGHTDEPVRVVRLESFDGEEVSRLLGRYGLCLEPVAPDQQIPGSYWGDEEAGLLGDRLYARPDTPVHSILHEACHYACMGQVRRMALHTDAGGDYDEENAVCYLQILLADFLPGFGREKMMHDMDLWGYSFRLGSAQSWFDSDAEDARQWLFVRGMIEEQGRPTFQLHQ